MRLPRSAPTPPAGRPPASLLVLLVLSAALVAACAGDGGPQPPRMGEVAPPYPAVTLEGDTVRLEAFRGRTVLLNLWATWCAPCREETPFLQSLYEENRDRGLEIVGISLDSRDQKEAVADFVEEYGVTYSILWDPAMRGMERYQVLGLPATFLLDAEGVIRWMRYGPVDETDDNFLMALEALLE